jgi:hypothetical protein
MPHHITTATDSTGDLPAASKSELDTGSTSNSESEVYETRAKIKGRDGLTFVTEGLAKDHYRPVETYEGIHRYDPDFEWKPGEEKRVVRKVIPAVLCSLMAVTNDL